MNREGKKLKISGTFSTVRIPEVDPVEGGGSEEKQRLRW